jgi:tetratricopeptide (TPR) repeat protein
MGVCGVGLDVYLTTTKRNLWIWDRAMALESVLTALIGSLDQGELAFVRKHFVGDELLLFTLLTRKKVLPAKQVRANFAHLTQGAYATMRTRLQDSVAAAVGEYHRLMLPDTQVQSLLHAAEVLALKGQPLHAQRMLAKTATLAVELHHHGCLPRLRALHERLSQLLINNKVAAPKWPIVDGLLQQLEVAQLHEQACKQWLKAAITIKAGSAEQLASKISELAAQLPPLDLMLQSKANLFLCRTHWICLRFRGQFAECESLVDWAIDVSGKQTWLWADLELVDLLEAAYFTKAIFLTGRLAFEDALALLDTMRLRWRGPILSLAQDWKDIVHLVRVKQLLHKGDAISIRRGLKRILKEIGKPQNVGDYLYSSYLRVIEYCLHAQNFELGTPWLALLNAAKAESKRIPKVIGSFLIELAYWLAAGDEDQLDNCIRRLSYFAKLKQADQHFVTVIASGFKSLASSSATDVNALSAFIDALVHLRGKEESEMYFQIFDLQAYLTQLQSAKGSDRA